ncbi:MAG: enoyl-CoA hydratase-related protein, partial [Burkholderiaceae bacterium]
MSESFVVDYQTTPERYRHWSLAVDGVVATLTMAVNEDGGLRDGYKLKLNSYDLGVDIELHDAIQRVRFEHPKVRVVVLGSGLDRTFCSGANIFMLGKSSHAWKVNFCKFTNETRNGLEDSSRYSGLKFLAAVNGACAGGGYELAAACDEILLVDDRSSSVSLPEVPLLGVLPGTGGLTRLTDKRKVRHDHADIFCTTSEGIRGQRAKEWRLVDEIAKPAQFAQAVRERAEVLAAQSDRAAQATGVQLTPLQREFTERGVRYRYVDVVLDRDARSATITVHSPATPQPDDIAGIEAAGVHWWPLQMARELDDAILHLRTNEIELGIWILETAGQREHVLACDASMQQHAS